MDMLKQHFKIVCSSLLVVVLVLVYLAHNLYALNTPVLIQAKSYANSGSSLALNSSNGGWSSSGSGNLIVVVLALGVAPGATPQNPTLTDNLGDTWVKDTSFDPGNGAAASVFKYHLANAPAGITSITANFTFAEAKIVALEYSNISTVTPLDVAPADKDNGYGVTSWSTNAAAVSQTNDVVIAYAWDWRSNNTLTANDNSFANETGSATANSGNLQVWDKTALATGNFSLSGTDSNTSQTQVYSGIIAFKASGGSSSSGPVITNIAASSIASSSATITWTTDTNSDSQVQYGTTTSYGSQSTLNSTLTTSHSVSLSGLSASTTYHYLVQSRDSGGNLGTSTDQTFTTSAASSSTAPSITSFNASPTSITNGQSTTLSWVVTGNPTPTLSISGIGTVTGSSVSVSPSATTTYTLTASSSAGTVTATTTVAVTSAPSASAGGPVLFFSDLTDGPRTGGENGKGAYACVYGKNFGASRGSSTITIGGVAVDNYPVWGSGNAIARGMDEACFQLGNSVPTGSQSIQMTVNGVTSNTLPFYVRVGGLNPTATDGVDAIYCVSDVALPVGGTPPSDSNDGHFGTTAGHGCWATMTHAYSVVYGMTSILLYVHHVSMASSAGSYAWSTYGASGMGGVPNAYFGLLGYPGAPGTIGTFGRGVNFNQGPWGAKFTKNYSVVANLNFRGMTFALNWGGEFPNDQHHFRMIGNDIMCESTQGGSGCSVSADGRTFQVYGNLYHDVALDEPHGYLATAAPTTPYDSADSILTSVTTDGSGNCTAHTTYPPRVVVGEGSSGSTLEFMNAPSGIGDGEGFITAITAVGSNYFTFTCPSLPANSTYDSNNYPHMWYSGRTKYQHTLYIGSMMTDYDVGWNEAKNNFTNQDIFIHSTEQAITNPLNASAAGYWGVPQPLTPTMTQETGWPKITTTSGCTSGSCTGNGGSHTYYVSFLWQGNGGETSASHETAYTIPDGSKLVVTAPSFSEGGLYGSTPDFLGGYVSYPHDSTISPTGWCVYVGTTSGHAKQQACSTTSGGTWTEPVSGITSSGSEGLSWSTQTAAYRGGYAGTHIFVHDNLIHDGASDGMRVGAVDPTPSGMWGDDDTPGGIYIYNNVIYKQAKYYVHDTTTGEPWFVGPYFADNRWGSGVCINIMPATHNGPSPQGNIYVENNTCYDINKGGWQDSGATWAGMLTHLPYLYDYTVPISNNSCQAIIEARNNLFVATESASTLPWISSKDYANYPCMNSFQGQNNLWWSTVDNTRTPPDASALNGDSSCVLGMMGTGTSCFTHNISADPLFTNPSTDDFHIQSSSPAKSGGVVTVATSDFDGIPRPQNGTYSIGAYEYNSGYVPPATYSVGGTVSGLTGTVVLQDNGGDNLSLSANGSFTFATQVASGSSYNVTVFSQPSGQTCTISNGSGSISSANIVSISVSCVSSTTAPNSPTGLSATPSNTQIALSWTAPSSNGGSALTQYFVYDRLTGSPTFALVATTSSSVTTSTITSLTNGQSYDFEVFAQNSIGTSTASNIVSATPATVPGAPTAVSASAGNAQATISFTTPISNGGSNILYYTATSNPGSISAISNGSPIVVTGLTNGQAYTFTVTATNVLGTSTPSSSSGSVTPTGLAPSVTSFSASPLFLLPGSSTTLSWNVSNASSLTVTPGGLSTTSLISSSSFSPASTTTYLLTATNVSGTSTAQVTVTIDGTSPSTPAGLSAITASASAINLSWTPSADNVGGSGLSGYHLYRNNSLIATLASSSSAYTDSGLSAYTVYSYYIDAFDAVGNISSSSSLVSATTQQAASGGGGGGGSSYSSGGGGGGYTTPTTSSGLSGTTASTLATTTKAVSTTSVNTTSSSVPSLVATLDVNLRAGATGEKVKILQNMLIQAKYLPSDTPLGYYGKLTTQAVQKFQCDQKIVCSGTPVSTGYGSVGNKTRAALNSYFVAVTPTASSLIPVSTVDTNSNDAIISALKEKLAALIKLLLELKSKEVETASSTSKTPEIATSTVSLVPPPIATSTIATTTPVIVSIPYVFTRDLKLGSAGAEVKYLQEYLNTHGYVLSVSGPESPGNETEYFDFITQDGLRRYQTAKGISPADGSFGQSTRDVINKEQ